MTTAVVVGAGPNGLAAAIVLAEAGIEVTVLEAADEIGGGTRTREDLAPGLLHDTCSATHPMAVGSDFLASRDLRRYGLEWAWPEIDCVHPLEDGSAGVLYRSVEATAAGLGVDARAWRLLFARTSAAYGNMCADIMRPLLRVPRHPLSTGRFGVPALASADMIARLLRTPQARGLFGGIAAHAFRPLHHPLSAAVGLGILTAGHAYGWAVATGGSRAITAAMAALLTDLGATIHTAAPVRSEADLPVGDIVVWDVAPIALARILGDRLPPRIAAAYRRFRHGPGAFKVDFAVEGGVPWTASSARRSGTVHLGGTYEQIRAAERDVHAGRLPSRPFVLVGQQYLADPTRSAGDIHPVWSYAHVPRGYTGDASAAVIEQIERFAPGFRDRVLGIRVRTPQEFADYNPNYVGGDIMTGAKDLSQLVFGPRTTLHPYDVGIPGHFLCSAATPPGPGAHGMCGVNAARRALRSLAADRPR